MTKWATAHGRKFKVETLDTGLKAPRQRQTYARFTKFPALWETTLAKARASGSTYAIAILLVYEAWKLSSTGHKPVVKVTRTLAKRAYVGDRGKRQALHKLEALKLISVDRRPYSSPLVTVHFLGE
jgi:hypothetical protein